jgi:hypothetical protein
MKDSATAQSRAGWTLAHQGPALGRFSTGMEKTGPSAEKDRIGRFSTGMEKTGPSAEKDRIGRFSTGMEKTGAERSRSAASCDAASPKSATSAGDTFQRGVPILVSGSSSLRHDRRGER